MAGLVSMDVLVVEHQHRVLCLSRQNVGLAFHSPSQSRDHGFVILLRAGDLGPKGRRNAGEFANEGALGVMEVGKELSFVLNVGPNESGVRVSFHYFLLGFLEFCVGVIDSEMIVLERSGKDSLLLKWVIVYIC